MDVLELREGSHVETTPQDRGLLTGAVVAVPSFQPRRDLNIDLICSSMLPGGCFQLAGVRSCTSLY